MRQQKKGMIHMCLLLVPKLRLTAKPLIIFLRVPNVSRKPYVVNRCTVTAMISTASTPWLYYSLKIDLLWIMILFDTTLTLNLTLNLSLAFSHHGRRRWQWRWHGYPVKCNAFINQACVPTLQAG